MSLQFDFRQALAAGSLPHLSVPRRADAPGCPGFERLDRAVPSRVVALFEDPSTTLVFVPEDSRLTSVFRLQQTLQRAPIYTTCRGSVPELLRQVRATLLSAAASLGVEVDTGEYETALEAKLGLMVSVTGKAALELALRNHFWSPEAVWHIDRVLGDDQGPPAAALRLNWSVGRAAGMVVTSPGNLRGDFARKLYEANAIFLSELCRYAWAHGQMAASKLLLDEPQFQRLINAQDDAVVFDMSLVSSVPLEGFSIHRVASHDPRFPGTPHHLDMANQAAPGLQAIISVPV